LQPIIDAKMDNDESDEDVHPVDKAAAGSPKPGKRNTSTTKTSTSGSLLKRPQRDTTQSLTISDFLQDLANALNAETMEMSLDYLRLHRFCWMLLRNVNGACKPTLLETYGGGYLEKENQLPWVVGYIFMAATETSRIVDLLIPRRQSVAVSSRLLAVAADVVKEMVKVGAGEIEVRMLEAMVGAEIDFGALD